MCRKWASLKNCSLKLCRRAYTFSQTINIPLAVFISEIMRHPQKLKWQNLAGAVENRLIQQGFRVQSDTKHIVYGLCDIF